MGKKFHG